MKRKVLLSMLVLCTLVPIANAATVFTGAVDNDFNNAGNWDTGLLPGIDAARVRGLSTPGAWRCA